ncbi:class I SAM-dependent methyltransferase [Actinomycetota bacterium]
MTDSSPDSGGQRLPNPTTFNAPHVVGVYASAAGPWTDPGERVALTHAARASRGRRILDIGVGAGRTTELLLLVRDDYEAIDYSPNMVAAARARLPEARVREGDVRDLAGVADGSKDLVVFSYNGLDSLDHDDRQRGLAEMARVLAPGGLLLYSTLGLHGPSARRTPWTIPPVPAGSRGARAAWAARQVYRRRRLITHVRNYREMTGRAEHSDGWAMLPLSAHDYALLVHFTTLPRIREEVASVGLVLERIIGDDGQDVPPEATDTDADCLHVLARRPA